MNPSPTLSDDEKAEAELPKKEARNFKSIKELLNVKIEQLIEAASETSSLGDLSSIDQPVKKLPQIDIDHLPSLSSFSQLSSSEL